MKHEEQVISFESAERLHELGVRKESLCKWRAQTDGVKDWWELSFVDLPGVYYAAYTVAELGELLPQYTKSWQGGFGLWRCRYHDIIEWSAKTEAEVRAFVLIYLITNKVIRPS